MSGLLNSGRRAFIRFEEDIIAALIELARVNQSTANAISLLARNRPEHEVLAELNRSLEANGKVLQALNSMLGRASKVIENG